jgi:hypothetical protein
MKATTTIKINGKVNEIVSLPTIDLKELARFMEKEQVEYSIENN